MLFRSRYQRADVDSDYISRPQTKWTIVGRLKGSGAVIQTKAVEDGSLFESEIKSDYKSTLSAGVSYLGASISLAINPAKLLGKYHDYELNFQSYGKKIGFDISYQDANKFKGWRQLDGQDRVNIPKDLLKLRILNINAFYVFNNRRFSYPAAFAHSYLQKRSAGSLMFAVSGQGQHGKTKEDNSSERDFHMDFKMTNIGIGAGYGYNYVPAKGWLLHISAIPTFIVYSNTSLTVGDTKIPLSYHFPEVIITGRGAVVKQIGNNKFAGFSSVFNFTNIGNEKSLAIHNIKWLARLYFGFRL